MRVWWWLGAGVWAGCQGGSAAIEPTPSESTGDPTDPGGTDPGTGGSCGSWLATYDLTGSHFYIQSMVDFTITVQEPYDDDLNTGPGKLVLRFPDDGGELGLGHVALVEYQLMWDFVTGVGGFADVHTELMNTSGPAECGVAAGELAHGVLEWEVPTIELCQDGQISCSGPFCGTSGAPPENDPEIVDHLCEPWDIHSFTFSQDLQTLDMAPAIASSDADSETAMEFHGTLVDMVRDEAPPDCFCP